MDSPRGTYILMTNEVHSVQRGRLVKGNFYSENKVPIDSWLLTDMDHCQLMSEDRLLHEYSSELVTVVVFILNIHHLGG